MNDINRDSQNVLFTEQWSANSPEIGASFSAAQQANHMDFTTVVGVDEKHLEELRVSWPTWFAFRPEILRRPLVLICDGAWSEKRWESELLFLNHRKKKIVLWQQSGVSQREKMLTALTLLAPKVVTTPWFLKLDTDLVATRRGRWIRKSWFKPDAKGQLPVFVAHKWGFTKPASYLDTLQEWGNDAPAVKSFSQLSFAPEQRRHDKVCHRRIISWCFFGRTDWARSLAESVTGRLPVPSQDTFHWYCAARQQKYFRSVDMKRFGWAHIGYSARELVNSASQALMIPSGQNETSTCTTTRPKVGVVYLLTGVSHAARLLVSIYSLRRFYSGPVVVVSTMEASREIVEKMRVSPDLRVEHQHIPHLHKGKSTSLLMKTAVPILCPYSKGIFLDADTLVQRDIGDLIDFTKEEEMVLTNFTKWSTQTKRIKNRLEDWRRTITALDPSSSLAKYSETLHYDRPAINTGVYGFTRSSPLLRQWQTLSHVGKKHFICDEIAMQILLSDRSLTVVDGRWNCSPHYSRDLDDVRIWHFHGEKHLKDYALPIWLPTLNEVITRNVADCRRWLPASDTKLQAFWSANPPDSAIGLELLSN